MLGLSLIISLKYAVTAMAQRPEKLQTIEIVSSVTLVSGIDRNLRRNLRKIRT